MQLMVMGCSSETCETDPMSVGRHFYDAKRKGMRWLKS